MSATTPCVPCCATPTTTNIPGPVGATGTPGSNGSNGINAYTFTTGNFTVPALSGSVTINVGVSSWAVVGQAVFIANGTAVADIYVVTAVPSSTSMTLQYENYTTNVNSGNTCLSGSGVSPGGFQSLPALPLVIANGGTNANTKAGAQTNLGLGQAAVISNVSGLSQNITASQAQVSTCGVTVPALGAYLVSAFITVTWGAFVSGTPAKTMTVRVQNTVQANTAASGVWNIIIVNASTTSDGDYHIPFVYVTTFAQNDTLQLQVAFNSITGVTSTASVTAGSLVIVPLHLS